MQNFYSKKKKLIFSKRGFFGRKSNIIFRPIKTQKSLTVSIINTVNLIINQCRIIFNRLNYKNNTVWKIIMITVISILAIFVIPTIQAEAKPFKLFSSIRINPISNKINPRTYSGLIIIIKGKNKFYPSMSPKIISKNGRSIFGNLTISHSQFNYLIREGIATFTDNIRVAKHRSGRDPLVINSISTKYNDTVIISNESAKQIVRENRRNNFLGKFKVSFVTK